MFRAALLSNGSDQLNNIFSKDVLEKIRQETEFLGIFESFEKFKMSGANRNVEVIFSSWNMPRVSDEEIPDVFPKLRAIFYAAGTVKYFAVPFLKRGIRIFAASEANASAVADFVTGEILLANKGFYQAAKAYKKGFYKHGTKKAKRFAEIRTGNYMAKIGLIGFGKTARKTAQKLKQFHMEVFAYDPYVDMEEMREYHVTKMSLENIFVSCDVISNHLPDIKSTKDMLNSRLFNLSKDGITFINTGRGAQVKERDLARMLRKNRNSCAVLDVVRNEHLIRLNPLYYCSNCFFTPHIAGSQSLEKYRLGAEVFDAFMAYKNDTYVISEIHIAELERMA